MKPTLISLFSGIGGLDLAAHWAGFETVRFVEKEPFCQKVLAKHWPNVPIDDDVFTSHPGHADVVCGGFPCQPFSVAGNRQGKDDERYLLPEMLRIVREVQPYAVLFENVPGFPSLNDGAEFKYLLGTLAEMGFDAQWGHIRASDVGAPHRRERWFCVAYSRSFGQVGANPDNRRAGTYNQKWFDTAHRDNRDSTSGGFGGSNLVHQSELEHTKINGLETYNIQSVGSESGFASERHNELGNWSRRQPQPSIRRVTHGLPGRLDFVGFPARPGEPQHAYEPSRTAPSTKETNARIKALGNAVVPQVAYPIFAALMEWFTELEASKAA